MFVRVNLPNCFPHQSRSIASLSGHRASQHDRHTVNAAYSFGLSNDTAIFTITSYKSVEKQAPMLGRSSQQGRRVPVEAATTKTSVFGG
ncbi:hypothetical protein PIB30_054939 [Stylosanthes scabra]|uniref:Uncharacterized protein n=1 Tax=Stylosanthes scabra TaxID=79078 RepID=A0ABU6YJE6_9FABA|nr:hypothetical protein [Stylosanthes scabra]